MRKLLTALTAALVLSGAGTALARQSGDELSQAVTLCRDEIAERAGVEASAVRFESVRTRTRAFQIELTLQRDGRSEDVSCAVSRAGDREIMALELEEAVQTQAAAAQ